MRHQVSSRYPRVWSATLCMLSHPWCCYSSFCLLQLACLQPCPSDVTGRGSWHYLFWLSPLVLAFLCACCGLPCAGTVRQGWTRRSQRTTRESDRRRWSVRLSVTFTGRFQMRHSTQPRSRWSFYPTGGDQEGSAPTFPFSACRWTKPESYGTARRLLAAHQPYPPRP